MDTEEPPHFHGKISRVEADQVLAGGPDGKYLMRVSTSAPGDYVLSMSSGGASFHFQIKSQGEVCSPLESSFLHRLDLCVYFHIFRNESILFLIYECPRFVSQIYS